MIAASKSMRISHIFQEVYNQIRLGKIKNTLTQKLISKTNANNIETRSVI